MSGWRNLLAFVAGLTFAIGLGVGGMTDPNKVLAFLDVTGGWDPSLAFVMGGALVVTAIGYRLIFRRTAPLFDGGFRLPTRSALDARLIGGSAIFGIGWGIAGYCPGGALPVLGVGGTPVLLFMASLIVGIYTARWLDTLRGNTTPVAQS